MDYCVAPAYRSTAVELIEFEELFATLCLSAFFAKSRLLCLQRNKDPHGAMAFLAVLANTLFHRNALSASAAAARRAGSQAAESHGDAECSLAFAAHHGVWGAFPGSIAVRRRDLDE